MNILSAHNTHFDTNKFGFQKVILVCDIENIKHLYEYRYGPKCDFEGYIEKFYTYSPFRFSIIDAIIQYCKNEYIVEYIDEDNRKILMALLVHFFEVNLLKIRNLTKIFNAKIDKTFPKKEYNSLKNFEQDNYRIISTFIKNPTIAIDYNDYKFLNVLHILSISFGGIRNLISAIEILTNRNEGITADLIDALINAISIISHISKSINEDSSRTFFVHEEIKFNHSFLIQVNILLPQIEFLSKRFEIPLKWTSENKYVSDNFFEYEYPDKLKNTFNNIRPFELANITWKNLGKEILSVLHFIKREGFFDDI